ncbi:MAG: hypothetical protein A3H97_12165 [Acidobacteria bacterium RIFCSPLOWO2_02_FULL_65_29]|nr:MAG: hypothetical protein A3H97_12165 [Acidobacteria bacterium RIFCSPLOWO2_02_FULL_65_29]
MPDFNVRSDSVNVEQVMDEIRARIREKRGVDYTEQQIREMAAVKLEKFLDPRGVRSDLLEQFRKAQPAYTPPDLPNYAFEDQTLYDSTRGPLRWMRGLLNPILKLFFNPNPLIQALNIQSRLNTMYGEREARREATRRAFDQLQYELMHNLVIETTRMSLEVKNLKMRVESLASRLEFNERRARALESVVVYKPSSEDRAQTAAQAAPAYREAPSRPPYVPAPSSTRGGTGVGTGVDSRPPASAPASGPSFQGQTPAAPASQGGAPGSAEGPGQRSRRRRRRRGRRGGGPVAAVMSQPGGAPAPPVPAAESAQMEPGSGQPSAPASPDQGLLAAPAPAGTDQGALAPTPTDPSSGPDQ